MAKSKRNILIAVATALAVLAIAITIACTFLLKKAVMAPIQIGVISGRGLVTASSSKTIKQPQVIATNKQFTLEESEKVNLKAAAEAGFNFTAFVNKSGETLSSTAEYSFKFKPANTEVFAKFTPAQFTISFDYNGAPSIIASQTVVFESVINDLPVPTKDGFLFAGWTYVDGTETKKLAKGDKYLLPKNITLKAKWSEIVPVNLTIGAGTLGEGAIFVENEATLQAKGVVISNIAGVKTYSIKIGLDVPVCYLPIMEQGGFAFNGWFYRDGTGSIGNTSIPLNNANRDDLISNKNITAIFPMFVKEFEITFVSSTGVEIKPNHEFFKIEKTTFNNLNKQLIITDNIIDWTSGKKISVDMLTKAGNYNYVAGYSFFKWTDVNGKEVNLNNAAIQVYNFNNVGVCQINTVFNYKEYTAKYKNEAGIIEGLTADSVKLQYKTKTSDIGKNGETITNKFVTPELKGSSFGNYFKKPGYTFCGWSFLNNGTTKTIEYKEDFEVSIDPTGKKLATGMKVLKDPNSFVLENIPVDINGVELDEILLTAVWTVNQSRIIYNFCGTAFNDVTVQPFTVGGKSIVDSAATTFTTGNKLSDVIIDSGIELRKEPTDGKSYIPLESDARKDGHGNVMDPIQKQYIHGYYIALGAYVANLNIGSASDTSNELTWSKIWERTKKDAINREKFLKKADVTPGGVNYSMVFPDKRTYFNNLGQDAAEHYGFITVFAVMYDVSP